ncbi:MAG: hypothetical protein QXG77_03330 [Nitrososphaerota archaeon]
MSNFGMLITASTLTIIIMLIFTQCTYIIQTGVGIYYEGLEALRHRISLESTAIEIINVTPQSNTTIYARIKNTGSCSIPVIQFNKMEIFVIGTLVNYTYPTVIRVPFDQSSIREEGWRVVSVYTNGVIGDVLNPIDLPSALSGKWDPLEELVIIITLSNKHALNLTHPISVVFVAPNGVSTVEGGVQN